MSWDATDLDDPTRDRPRYCGRCRKPGGGGSELCVECGERLIGQGYCGVCERHWLLPAGDPCPKHDLPLEPECPPLHPLLTSGEPLTWATVARYATPAEAQPPRLRLEAEGIPTFLDGERVANESAYQLAVGGVRLQVPAALVSEARILLGQNWADSTVDDLDDAYEELAPEPGRRRRAVMRALIVVVLLLPLIQAFALVVLRALSRGG